jgi:hypothetical protein
MKTRKNIFTNIVIRVYAFPGGPYCPVSCVGEAALASQLLGSDYPHHLI